MKKANKGRVFNGRFLFVLNLNAMWKSRNIDRRECARARNRAPVCVPFKVLSEKVKRSNRLAGVKEFKDLNEFVMMLEAI